MTNECNNDYKLFSKCFRKKRGLNVTYFSFILLRSQTRRLYGLLMHLLFTKHFHTGSFFAKTTLVFVAFLKQLNINIKPRRKANTLFRNVRFIKKNCNITYI